MVTTQTIVRCGACSGLNAHGLPYCMYCGHSLEGTEDVRIASPRPCRSCSIIDALSQKFCINCGENMNSNSGESTKNTDSMSSSQRTTVPNDIKSKTTGTYRTARAEARKKRSKQTLLIFCLLSAGSVASIYGISQFQEEQNTGIMVHASPAGAEVLLEDNHEFLVKSGKINSQGELLMKGVKPGHYSLTLTQNGFEPLEQPVDILPNKISSIGIPKPLELKAIRENSEGTDSSGENAVSESSKSTPNIARESAQRIQPLSNKRVTRQTESSSTKEESKPEPPLAPPIQRDTPALSTAPEITKQELPDNTNRSIVPDPQLSYPNRPFMRPFGRRQFGQRPNFQQAGQDPFPQQAGPAQFGGQNTAQDIPDPRFGPKVRRFRQFLQQQPYQQSPADLGNQPPAQ